MYKYISILILVAVALLSNCYSYSQNWEYAGPINNPPYALYEDSIDNVFYIAGNFSTIKGKYAYGICKWNGDSIAAMGCGIGRDCNNNTIGNQQPVRSIIRFQNKIFVTGGFDIVDNMTVNGIACWNGTNWSGFGQGLKAWGGQGGVGLNFKIFNNELYLCGTFDSINGIEANGLAKYNGTNWTPVQNVPLFSNDAQEPNQIFDVEFYGGDIYIGGMFNSNLSQSNPIVNIARYNGTSWVNVNVNLPAGIFGEVIKMYELNNKLYLFGSFSKSGNSSIIGNGVAMYDGNSWRTFGNGITNAGGQFPVIYNALLRNNFFYIVGSFINADNIVSNSIVRFDGNQFCSYLSNFDNTIYSVGFYQDTLYIGGGFWTINGDSSLAKFAKWRGGELDSCSTPLVVKEINNNSRNFTIYPNPSNGYFNIQFQNSETVIVSVYNSIGEEIKNCKIANAKSFQLDLSNQPKGMYYIKMQNNKFSKSEKILID